MDFFTRYHAKINKNFFFMKAQKTLVAFLLVYFLSNILTVTSSFGQIGNNHIDFTNGLHGTLCVTQAEADPGPSPYAVFTAPAGTVFTTISFASYGTPIGSCGAFNTGSCHAAVNRVPAADDLRSNMVRGGAAKATELSPREREICTRLGPALRERGLLFVGIDVIGGFLTEINVTSPTGIRAVARLGGPDIAAKIWDAIEARRR